MSKKAKPPHVVITRVDGLRPGKSLALDFLFTKFGCKKKQPAPLNELLLQDRTALIGAARKLIAPQSKPDIASYVAAVHYGDEITEVSSMAVYRCTGYKPIFDAVNNLTDGNPTGHGIHDGFWSEKLRAVAVAAEWLAGVRFEEMRRMLGLEGVDPTNIASYHFKRLNDELLLHESEFHRRLARIVLSRCTKCGRRCKRSTVETLLPNPWIAALTEKQGLQLLAHAHDLLSQKSVHLIDRNGRWHQNAPLTIDLGIMQYRSYIAGYAWHNPRHGAPPHMPNRFVAR